MQANKNWWWILAGLVLVAAVVLIWFSQKRPFYPEINSPRPYLGAAAAEVVVEEFSDFQCPACRSAQLTIKDVAATFADRIKFVYKHYPLVSIHTQAFGAAAAAECANDQGAFWAYHDRLFAAQPQFGRADLIVYARDLNLDEAKFTTCFDARAKTEIVRQDMREGDKRGVNATPTFFINGDKVDDWTKLKELIQAKLLGG